MDGNLFDRITRALFASLPRRNAVRALAGSGVAAVTARIGLVEVDARKRRCRKRGRRCGGKNKCCGNKLKCQNITKPECDHVIGKRCCGLAGAVCSNDPGHNNCDCCDGFFCSGTSGQGQCQSTPT